MITPRPCPGAGHPQSAALLGHCGRLLAAGRPAPPCADPARKVTSSSHRSPGGLSGSQTPCPRPQHCILSIGVHIALYMKLLHLARNMHLARIARNMHDSVICADCARHAPVMQNYDRFLALRAMCTSSKFTIVRNMRIVSKWAYCAPCALRYAHYMHICQNPPDRVCTRLGL